MSTLESSFLLIPIEIRLMIYSYLIPQSNTSSPPRPSPPTLDLGHPLNWSAQDDEPLPARTSDKPILQIRMLDPTTAHPMTSTIPNLHRTKLFIRTGRFRARTMSTTYVCTNLPSELDVSILMVCKKTHFEAVGMLYGSYTFDFDTHVEAIPPFFSDLTEHARHCVKRVSLVKRALAYDRSSDLCEWASATSYLASSLPSLRLLDLGMVAGKPATGWPDVPVWNKEECEMMARVISWRGLEWVQDIREIRIKEGGTVNVRPVMENCPPVRDSEMLNFWVGVSRSLCEGGFGEWVTDMVLAS
jgi:hypothetical protein